MRRLFEFLYRFRAFLVFVVLELFCVWLIVRNNTYQGVAYLNTSSKVVAELLSASNSANEFVNLRETNYTLAQENARLNALLQTNNMTMDDFHADTMQLRIAGLDSIQAKPEMTFVRKGTLQKDTTENFRYSFFVAKVINNSVNRFNNYLTINKGLKDGIAPGMGIVSPQGIVGKVRFCSENFSTVTSVLHSSMSVSSQIKSSKAFGSVKWDGVNPRYANLQYIPRHHTPAIGDTIVTSGYNATYPEGVMVGVISKVNIKDNDAFYDIRLELSTDFQALTYVYIISNNFRAEQDSIQALTSPTINE
jgi:rod shape-determining protein MreC